MLNTIRADFYRLKYTKGFWITQVLLIGMIVFSIATQSVGTIGSSNEEMAAEAAIATTMKWTGVVAMEEMPSMIFLLTYFLLPLVVIILGQDFSKQTYKNSLTVGVSREKYFLSKFITLTLVVALQLFYFYLMSFVVGTILNGVGEGLTGAFVFEMFQYYLLQLLFVMAVMTIPVFAIYLTGNIITSVLSTIIVPLAINIFQAMLPKVTVLKWFDFQGMSNNVLKIGLDYPDLPKHVLAAAIFIIVSVIGSMFVFNKKEL